MDPVLIVLLFGGVAAVTAAVGALPILGRASIPSIWMGWSNALAGGLMLGAAYVLTAHVDQALELGAGALLGILFIHWIHLWAGTDELDLDQVDHGDAAYGYRVLIMGAFHSGWEGLAIGAAAAVELRFGVFMALALAVHNIPEGTILCAVLRAQGIRLGSGAVLAVAVNVPQVLFGVAAYAVISAAPAVLPWAVGFAAGTLLDLVLVELLPQSYRQAGKVSIAVVAAVAMGMVVLVEGMVG
ncbi:MAG: hypothetical protein PVG07_12275 [Acidobacteriota bacterium]|jgi:zinc transporter ZupT